MRTLLIFFAVVSFPTVSLRAQDSEFQLIDARVQMTKGPGGSQIVGSVADLRLQPGELERLSALGSDRLSELLDEAVGNGNIGATRDLLDAGADPDDDAVSHGHLVLLCSTNRLTYVLGILLEYGADPNVADGFGVTPLMNVAKRGDTRAVRLLLDAGGDVARWDRCGRTALDYAKDAGKVDVVELLECGKPQ